MGKAKKKKLPFVYQPIGFVLSWASGALAGMAFRKAWMTLRHEEEAPDALDPDRGWGRSCWRRRYRGRSSPWCRAR